VKWIEHSDNQHHLQMSFLCEGEWSDQISLYHLLCFILSDGLSARLPFRLREELGLVYDIDAGANLNSEHGTIDITASVAVADWQKVLVETATVLRDFAEHGPTEDEFSKASHRMRTDLRLFRHAPEPLGNRVAWHALNHQPYKISTSLKQLGQITKQDLQKSARKIFTAKNCGLAILGPKEPAIEKRALEILSSALPSSVL
jgi:predicted Zn-dependent peptidase